MLRQQKNSFSYHRRYGDALLLQGISMFLNSHSQKPMPDKTLDAKTIDLLREQHECRNYLSPNRRDFYKILLVTGGAGIFTMGLNTYYID